MRRVGRHAGLFLVAVLALAVGAGTAVAAKPDKLTAAIEHRLAGAGNLTFPMAPVSDYFNAGMLKPENGFYTYACLDSGQPFRLAIAVYKTAAQAATAYQEGIEHVRAIGGDFHAFFMVRTGRVLYMGSTAGGPSPSNPTLPLKAFHSLVGLANGASWSRGKGCGSPAPLTPKQT
jgi:hypothetical protein